MASTQDTATTDKLHTLDANAIRAKGLPFPEYFSALAAGYARQTGNATRNMFAAHLAEITGRHPIVPGSRIHDNAAGPGTATSVLVKAIPSDVAADVDFLVTDNSPAMVAAARESFPTLAVREMDACRLDVPDGHFSHSVSNFSIFALADPLASLRETRRTLREGGLAAVLSWRSFGVGNVVWAAQKLVRPDSTPMVIPREELMMEGVLEELVVEAGFERAEVTVTSKRLVVEGPDLDGLHAFFLSDFTKPARVGWSEEDVAQWPGAIERAVQAEIAAHGGVLFESWVVLAKK